MDNLLRNDLNDASIAEKGIDLREFNKMTLPLQQKIMISEWQNCLIDPPGATTTMINFLEMIIQYFNDITDEE